MMIRVIGQELIDCGMRWEIGRGVGIIWPEYAPRIEIWSGLGPHSNGGTFTAQDIREGVCGECGARWFMPLLVRLKSGDIPSLEEIESAHEKCFGRPMLKCNSGGELHSLFLQHVRTDKSPEAFFPCHSVRRQRWDDSSKTWMIVG
jgi:hypothetical protein